MEPGDDTVNRRPTHRFRRVLGDHPTLAMLFGLTLLALLARLAFLGERIAHFDEARVAYWAMHYLESGEFHYRYIVHGPLVQHIDRWLFALVGGNDFTMRLPIAIIGGLLPASVLLFRDHLRDSELLGVAFFLAFNPILLYYSRFFRSSLPAIAFAFVAFGLLVRAYDTRKPRYVHGAVAFVALAFTAKENAIVYLLVWVGATVLLLDHVLYRPRGGSTGVDVLVQFWERHVRDNLDTRSLRRVGSHVVFGALVFCAVMLFFYAPRAGNTGGVGLWKTLTDPTQFPALVDVTLHGSNTYPRQPGIFEGYEYWLGGGIESGRAYESILDRYIAFAGVAFRAIGQYAAPLAVLGIIGFLRERYAIQRSRYIVLFAFYWGFVSLLGFPLGSDIASAWLTVNGLVPLALPAGIALAGAYRWGRSAWADSVAVPSIVAALIFLVVVFSMAQGLATGVYQNDQSPDNSLVQFAQPADDIRPVLHEIRAASTGNDGTDVLFFGDGVVAGPKEETVNTVYPACSRMAKMLPLPWYIAIYDSNATCVFQKNLSGIDGDNRPPVVVTKTNYDPELESMFGDYVERQYYLRALGGQTRFLIAPEYASENDG